MTLQALLLQQGSTAIQDTHSTLPLELITGTGTDPRPRLRVDQAQTSFYENREFRVYHEFSIAAASSLWLRWVFLRDVLVHQRDISITASALRFAFYTNGTPAGSWTSKPIYRVNNLSSAPAYVGNSAVAYGGTVSAGAEADVMLLNTGTGGNSSTASTSVSEGGLLAGTYYVELRNTGAQTCVGLYRVNFEEYQPRSDAIAT